MDKSKLFDVIINFCLVIVNVLLLCFSVRDLFCSLYKTQKIEGEK